MLTHKGTVTLKTERLVLRKVEPGDAQAMFDAYANDPRVTKFLSWSPHGDVKNTRALLESWEKEYEKPDCYNWAITLGGRMIGAIGAVSVNDRDERCEIGYCVAYDYWGKGIMTEALRAVLRFLFDEVGMRRVMARHDTANPASGRVMQKCGMTYEGTLRSWHTRNDRSVGDAKVYSILRDEFRA